MTDLAALLEETMDLVRQQKESTVATSPESPDMLSSVTVFRGGEKVAIMGCLPDRDVQMWLLKLAICGMDADEVTFSMETCHTKHPVNPGTGMPWKQGEMQEALRERPDWLVSGMVKEGVTTFCWSRNGEMEAASQEFEIKGNTVEWLPTEFTTISDDETPIGRMHGFIHDEVSMMWHEESTYQVAISEAKRLGMTHLYEGKSEVRLRTEADIVMAQYIIAVEPSAFCGLMSSEDPEDERTKLLVASKGWHPGLSKFARRNDAGEDQER